jgi:PKD repeat protein
MKRSKCVSFMTIIFTFLSAMIQLNVINEACAATPGVNTWGDATRDLEYGVSYSNVSVNSSAWVGTSPFFLYYPIYQSGGTVGNANEFTWNGPYQVSDYSARVTEISKDAIIDTGGAPIVFNRSGIWIFDADSTHAGDDPGSYAGYIWVNTSTKYSIDSIPNIYYGMNGSIYITVNTGNDTGCMIAIVSPDNRTIYHKWRATGVTEAIGIKGNFTLLGDYTVKSYKDFDRENSTYYYPDEYYVLGGVTENYSTNYGSGYTGNFPVHPSTTPEYYTYSDMGPWDPPEKNATEITFQVVLGESPTANFTYEITDLSVTFDGSPSYAPNGTIATWHWDFGDGGNASGKIRTHEYRTSGAYAVTLTVTDDNGVSDSITKSILVETYQTVLIFGTITNLSSQGDFERFQAVKTRVITFRPAVSFHTYQSGETFIIMNDWIGSIVDTPRHIFIVVLCKRLV